MLAQRNSTGQDAAEIFRTLFASLPDFVAVCLDEPRCISHQPTCGTLPSQILEAVRRAVRLGVRSRLIRTWILLN